MHCKSLSSSDFLSPFLLWAFAQMVTLAWPTFFLIVLAILFWLSFLYLQGPSVEETSSCEKIFWLSDLDRKPTSVSWCIWLILFINYNHIINFLSLTPYFKLPEVRKNVCLVHFRSPIPRTVLEHFGSLDDISLKQFHLGNQHFIVWVYLYLMMPLLLPEVKIRWITANREQNCLS